MSEHLFVRKEVCRNSMRKWGHVSCPAMRLGRYSLCLQCIWDVTVYARKGSVGEDK